MKVLSKRICQYLKNNSNNPKFLKYEEVYLYGIELVLSSMLGLLIVMFEGIILGTISESVFFYITFVSLRVYTGGYHAKSYLKCNVLFAVSVFICLCLQKMMTQFVTVHIGILLGLFNMVFFYVTAPVANVKKPLDKARVKKCKKISIAIQGVLIIFMIVMTKYNCKQVPAIIFAMALVDGLIVIELGRKVLLNSINNLEKEKKDERKND